MRLLITIDCDNDAFGDDPGIEAGRILNKVARFIEQDSTPDLSASNGKRLMDINGNGVGRVKVTS